MDRIVQIGSFPLSVGHIRGGVEASVYGLSNALSGQFDVHVFDVPRICGKRFVEKMGNITIHRYNNSGNRQITARRQSGLIAKEIYDLHPYICHIHGTSLFAFEMYKELVKKGLPVIVTVHGLASVEKRNALKKSISIKRIVQYIYQGWVEKLFLSKITNVIVDTEYVKEMVNSYPLRRRPIINVIPQGIDEVYYSKRCLEDSRVVLSVGAIGERKGHLMTLKAFELVEKKGCDLQLIIAGTVADKDYLSRLQFAIEQSICRNKIMLCTELSDEDMKRLYEKAHLFVLHSEEESQGIVFAEAMAVGLPIVATNVGGVPFVVRHGKNGLLSNYGDVESFAENICQLMNDKKTWQAMSIASMEFAHAFHWSTISNGIVQLYQLIV